MFIADELITKKEMLSIKEHLILNERARREKWSQIKLVRSKRTLNSAMAIVEKLKYISFEALTTAQYLHVEKNVSNFVRKYEYQMEGAKLQPDQFINTLDAFYTDMAQYILKNNNLQTFMEFYHAWDERHLIKSESDIVQHVVFCYMDLLAQQMEYLTDDLETICCGITTHGDLIKCDDKFPYIDIPVYKLTEQAWKLTPDNIVVKDKSVNLYDITEVFKRYGYIVNTTQELMLLQTTSRVWTNTTISLSYFINEYTMDMVIETPFVFDMSFSLPREWKSTQFYREELKHRKYLLPSNGVYAEYRNAHSIKTIKFKEIIKNDTVYLLYLSDTVNGQIAGYYNTKTDAFFCVFSKSSQDELSEKFENFILENYYRLTVRDIDFSKKKLSCMIVVANDFKEAEKLGYTQYQPLVKYYYCKGKQKNWMEDGRENATSNPLKKQDYKPYIREKYIGEKKSINGMTRKLPAGQKASDEAIEYAKSIGIILDANETYVKPFIKTVLRIRGKENKKEV